MPGRRDFLRRLGAVGAAAVALPASGCSVIGRIGSHTLDFDTDFGVLNYAFTLETMEADFYNRVIADPPRDLRPGELEILRDIRDHEVTHQRFFSRALGPLKIDVPERDFSSVDFSSRESVLSTSRLFEDTGTAAYNGAGKFLSLAEFLTIAGEIVSVEARQAAVLRSLLSPDPRAFAGGEIIDEFGMERALNPPEVFAIVGRFFRTPPRLTGL
jgi:hypothetical protein